MKNKGIGVLLIGALVSLFSCTKLESSDLVGTFWNGTLTATDYAEGIHTDLAFAFKDGKADFTYLQYGELVPEEGIMLYSMSEETFTIEKANEILNGDWNIVNATRQEMTLERTEGSNTLTISINNRK